MFPEITLFKEFNFYSNTLFGSWTILLSKINPNTIDMRD
jgi:hypothetical protein